MSFLEPGFLKNQLINNRTCDTCAIAATDEWKSWVASHYEKSLHPDQCKGCYMWDRWKPKEES